MTRVLAFAAVLFTTAIALGADLALVGNLDGEIALHGYDAVSYFTEKKPLKGKPELSHEHQGAKFRFANAENLKKFKAEPTKYEAAYGGWCAYAMADADKVDVDPETYKIIEGKIYLFYNGWLGNTLKKWNPKESELKPKADEAWRKLGEGKKS